VPFLDWHYLSIILYFHLTAKLPPNLLKSQLVVCMNESIQANNVEAITMFGGEFRDD